MSLKLSLSYWKYHKRYGIMTQTASLLPFDHRAFRSNYVDSHCSKHVPVQTWL